uniref:Uncharacterized protein n=1 Tax=Ascaris lumbricoides TaxID=6252 RepID=A0A0M3I294_ASCLU
MVEAIFEKIRYYFKQNLSVFYSSSSENFSILKFMYFLIVYLYQCAILNVAHYFLIYFAPIAFLLSTSRYIRIGIYLSQQICRWKQKVSM